MQGQTSLRWESASIQDLEISEISSWPASIKFILALIVSVLILSITSKLFYLPRLNDIKVEQLKEQDLKREFEEKQTLAENLIEYEDQMHEVEKRLQTLLEQLPNKQQVPELLADISKAGRTQGMVFKRFEPTRPVQLDFYERLPIKIEASGTYHQLAQFISTIANFERVVTVGDFDIMRSPQTGGQPDLTTPLTIKADIFTYHFNELRDSAPKSTDPITNARAKTSG